MPSPEGGGGRAEEGEGATAVRAVSNAEGGSASGRVGASLSTAWGEEKRLVSDTSGGKNQVEVRARSRVHATLPRLSPPSLSADQLLFSFYTSSPSLLCRAQLVYTPSEPHLLLPNPLHRPTPSNNPPHRVVVHLRPRHRFTSSSLQERRGRRQLELLKQLRRGAMGGKRRGEMCG